MSGRLGLRKKKGRKPAKIMTSSGSKAVQSAQFGEMDGVSWMEHLSPSLSTRSGTAKVTLTRSVTTPSTYRCASITQHSLLNAAELT